MRQAPKVACRGMQRQQQQMFHSQLQATSSYTGVVSASFCARVCVAAFVAKEWPCQRTFCSAPGYNCAWVCVKMQGC